RDTYKAVTSLGAPPIPSGVGRDEGEKRRENPDAKRAGTEETALFDIVNRKRRGAMHRQCAGALSRLRQRARVPAERAPRHAFFREAPLNPRRAVARAWPRRSCRRRA